MYGSLPYLVRYFWATKYASFKRQLSWYKFVRIRHGPDKNAFYHEFFLRGRPDLTVNIKRIETSSPGTAVYYPQESSSKTHKRGAVDPQASESLEPNFYRMPACEGLSDEDRNLLVLRGRRQQQNSSVVASTESQDSDHGDRTCNIPSRGTWLVANQVTTSQDSSPSLEDFFPGSAPSATSSLDALILESTSSSFEGDVACLSSSTSTAPLINRTSLEQSLPSNFLLEQFVLNRRSGFEPSAFDRPQVCANDATVLSQLHSSENLHPTPFVGGIEATAVSVPKAAHETNILVEHSDSCDPHRVLPFENQTTSVASIASFDTRSQLYTLFGIRSPHPHS